MTFSKGKVSARAANVGIINRKVTVEVQRLFEFWMVDRTPCVINWLHMEI